MDGVGGIGGVDGIGGIGGIGGSAGMGGLGGITGGKIGTMAAGAGFGVSSVNGIFFAAACAADGFAPARAWGAGAVRAGAAPR